MPFTLIKGTFMPAAGIPDGDTVRFRADNPLLLCGLERKVDPLDINSRNCTVALRYEGIDAPERGAREPFACDATARISTFSASVMYTIQARGIFWRANLAGGGGLFHSYSLAKRRKRMEVPSTLRQIGCGRVSTFS